MWCGCLCNFLSETMSLAGRIRAFLFTVSESQRKAVNCVHLLAIAFVP